MFKNLIKNKKAQNIAEYAILISLVVAAIIAMQTYVQRGLSAKVRSSVQYLAQAGTGGDGNLVSTDTQYEAYYTITDQIVSSNQEKTELLGNQLSRYDDFDRSTTEAGATRQTIFNAQSNKL